MIKRMLSILLVVLTVFGMLPGTLFVSAQEVQKPAAAQAQSAPAAQPIVVDFKQTALDMAEQDFWKDMRSTKNLATGAYVPGLKGVGNYGSIVMTEEELRAYDAMLAWLQENANWTICEEKTSFKKQYETRRMVFNTTDEPWGIRMHTGYLNTDNVACEIQLVINAPYGGTYDLDMTMFLPTQQPNWDHGNGGGFASVYVGDKLVLEEYQFLGDNETEELSLGEVELNRGENIVRFRFLWDMNGNYKMGLADSERIAALCDMTFTPKTLVWDLKENTTQTFELRGIHLPEDSTITAAEAENEQVAKAWVDENGMLVLQALQCGETTVEVKDGSRVVYSFDLTVTKPDPVVTSVKMMATTEEIVPLEGLSDSSRVISSDDSVAKAQIKDGALHLTAYKTGFVKITVTDGVSVSHVIHLLVTKYVEPVPEAGRFPLETELTETTVLNFSVPAAGSYRVYLGIDGDAVAGVMINSQPAGAAIALSGTVGLGAWQLNKGNNIIKLVGTKGEGTVQYVELVPVSEAPPVQVLEGQRSIVTLQGDYLPEDAEIGEKTYTTASTDDEIATAAFNTLGQLKVYGHAPGKAEILVQSSDLTVCFVEVEVLDRVGDIPVPETVEMNFAADMAEIASLDWWEELKATSDPTKKVLGSHPPHWLGSMTASETAAYDKLLQWLEENRSWNIDEEKTKLKDQNMVKSITINSSMENFGLLYYSSKYLNEGDNSTLFLTVDAPATGLYAFEMSAYIAIGTFLNVDNICGGGIADIYVNGEKVLERYAFGSNPPYQAEINLGMVELDEGENTIAINMLSDSYKGTNNSDRAPALYAMTFTPVTAQQVQEFTKKTVNLNKMYLPFDVKVSPETHEAVSSDEKVVTAELNENGHLVLEGIMPGEAEVEVWQAGEVICTVDVAVTAYTGDIDGLGGNPVRVDLTEFDGQVSFYVPAEGYYALNVDGSCANADVFVNDAYLGSVKALDGKKNLGAAYFVKGTNTVSFDGQIDLRSMSLVPLSTLLSEIGRDLYVDMDDTFLPTGADAADYTMVVADPSVVRTGFDADGEFVLIPISLGETTIDIVKDNKTVAVANLRVLPKTALQKVVMTLDGFTAATLTVGQTARGTLTGYTTQQVPVAEKQLRSQGSVYFSTSNSGAAKVEQQSGDVTCYGEGTAVITGYALLEGVSKAGYADLSVTDETDLSQIRVVSNVDFVGIGTKLDLWTEGSKASGGSANMDLYPVSWSVDDSAVASVSEDGVLTGHQTGTVTVTATAGVMRREMTASKTICVVENSLLPGDDIILRFTASRSLELENWTLEKDGVELNRDLTYDHGEGINPDAQSISLKVEQGQGIAFDFIVKKPGWYRTMVDGMQISYLGMLNDVLVDDQYIGTLDTATNLGNFGAGGYMNTIWLDVGKHTIKTVAHKDGTIFLREALFQPTEDPNEITVELTAGKTELLIGESTTITPVLTDANGKTYYLRLKNNDPGFTNYYSLKASDKKTAVLVENTLTAAAPGTVTVTATCNILGKVVTKQLEIVVKSGSFLDAELTADRTTVRPNADPEQITLTAFTVAGEPLETLDPGVAVSYESSDETIALVSDTGLVSFTGECGSALITATLTEGDRTVQTSLWFTVTEGKTEPTVYTYEERAAAQENVMKYDWAWSQKESAVKMADYYVENLDLIYEMWIPNTFPRTTQVGFRQELGYKYCRYCKTDLVALYEHYPYLVDPIKNPWKITCPVCRRDFPSNDFESYYKSGLDETGKFNAELADPQYLVNELYPEMGEGWGVDDGWGYFTGNKDANGVEEVHTYITYYLGAMFRKLSGQVSHSMEDILRNLMNAYLYTGDEKYGNAGAILVDRICDIYPEYEFFDMDWINYCFADALCGMGKFIGITWDGELAQHLAKAVDAFWPCMENEEVIEYLRGRAAWKGVAPEEITPEYLRTSAEEDILLEIKKCAENGFFEGNFGMVQSSVGYAAIALDRFPETQEMIEWLFKEERVIGSGRERVVTGGDVMRVLVEDVSRDGYGNEGSYSYNTLWTSYLVDLADALKGYDKVEGADLWKNQKFVHMYTGASRFTICGRLTPQIHESGSVQSRNFLPKVAELTTAFVASGNRDIARALYAANGNSTEGIHGDIFAEDPEFGIRNQIEQIVREDGEWDYSDSDMMAGYGIAILREGPARYIKGVNEAEFSDFWMGFGHSEPRETDHAQLEALNIDLEAFGLGLSSSMGYPMIVQSTDHKRQQWVNNTVSNNTVVVDDMAQTTMQSGGFPMHFEDAGRAKIIDVDASRAYEQTDIYRRTLVAVQAPNGVHYAVDFFRILGGSEHVYSFHGATMIEPELEGLNMVKQPFGSYAGADVPWGEHDISGTGQASLNVGSGYSWLDDVYRDNEPESSFAIDWQIEDFNSTLSTSSGIHLKLHMVSEEPMTEVALADGTPPTRPDNPDHLEYALIRRSGRPGMDTLFTAVLEPYQYENYVKSVELVDVTLTDGTEQAADRAACVKVTLISGREDYVVYTTNPNCTYDVGGKFFFRGFAGVASYENDVLTYAWGNEVSLMEDHTIGGVIKAQAAVTGEVIGFTEGLADTYSVTIRMDQPVTEEAFNGRYLYVNNDGRENAVYRIHGAKVSGDQATLDLYAQTLVREYVDSANMDLGYIHNIEVGQTYTIPLSAAFDAASVLNYTVDQVMKVGYRLDLQVGVENSDVTYELEGSAKGMKFDAAAGKITWMPTKTQVGRYPIAVKAVNENGDTLATMEFVIYVVAYTGASYDASVCKHSKAITYTVDGVDETICPACGLVTKTGGEEEPEEKPIELIDIAGTNMNLGNELALNFMFPKALDESKSY
ncbi:MAG: Ig-like domain-containing protein, partial [Oscillospiraceae bacterium]|nr:Ig-like domain-containing protein [Oscillospiraceae bacterium]